VEGPQRRELTVTATAHRQRGMSILGFLMIAIMVGFFVMSGLRIAPGYFEYLTVRDIVERVAGEFDTEVDTISDIRRSLADYLNTNQVDSISYKEIVIERRDGEIVIDASYEDRQPLFWRIDAVVKYDDLIFIAGTSYD
jgi:hypothetical protein